MDFLLNIVVVLAAIMAALYAIGRFLNPTWSGTSSFEIKGKLPQVWDAITDVEAISQWRRDVDKVEIVSDVQPARRWVQYPTEGPPATFIEISKTPMSVYETQMLSNGKLSVDWIFRLSQVRRGVNKVNIDVVCTISVTHPFYKFLSRQIFKAIGQIFDANMGYYQEDLQNYIKRSGPV